MESKQQYALKIDITVPSSKLKLLLYQINNKIIEQQTTMVIWLYV